MIGRRVYVVNGLVNHFLEIPKMTSLVGVIDRRVYVVGGLITHQYMSTCLSRGWSDESFLEIPKITSVRGRD